MEKLLALLAQVDETWRKIPPDRPLRVKKVAQALPDNGVRPMLRRGSGMDLSDLLEYHPQRDEWREISHIHTARFPDKFIVAKREAEIRHHVYLWRKATMNDRKRNIAEIDILALIKKLVKDEDAVGIIGDRGIVNPARAVQIVGSQLIVDVSIVTGADHPEFNRALPPNSLVIPFSDFWDQREKIAMTFNTMVGQRLAGYPIQVVDPDELEFPFTSNSEFKDAVGSDVIPDPEASKAGYLKNIAEHVDWLKTMSKARGFTFIQQRTDHPPENALLPLFGVTPKPVKPGPK
jgi:hypothetical protein